MENTTNVSESLDGRSQELCGSLSHTFRFPVLEILVIIQMSLPILCSFAVPCCGAFTLETLCSYFKLSTKVHWRLTNILIDSWFHWYMHWELWSWFWVSTGLFYISFCDLPPRFYEYSLGIGTASIFISTTSNIFSDFRDAIPRGWMRNLFNASCLLLFSWPLRIIYPIAYGISTLHRVDFMDEDEFEISGVPRSLDSDPPNYMDIQVVVPDDEPPPSYQETLARIRRQLPKLGRSISLKAHIFGRSMSSLRGKHQQNRLKSHSTTRKKELERQLEYAEVQEKSF